MTPYWLLVDVHDLAKFAALTFVAGCAWVAFAAREFASHRSTVERSTSGEFPSLPGVDRWVVEATERDVVSDSRAIPVAAKTEHVVTGAPVRVGHAAVPLAAAVRRPEPQS